MKHVLTPEQARGAEIGDRPDSDATFFMRVAAQALQGSLAASGSSVTAEQHAQRAVKAAAALLVELGRHAEETP